MGRRHGGRPNKQRVRTTVYLGPKDQEAIREIQKATFETTTSGAIRHALAAAMKSPPETVSVGHRILAWANKLQFMSPREKRELYELSRELYQIVRDAER